MPRPKHPNKELEALLAYIEMHGWIVTKPAGYFFAKCPCGSHMKWVHLTPSDHNYEKNTRKWFERQECWGQGEKLW